MSAAAEAEADARAPGAGGHLDTTPALAELSTQLGRHARVLHVLKPHLAVLAPMGLDWAAVSLLVQLVRCGPRRQGELAEAARLDPSTVSRYVGQLVREGLVERRPDPADGRAVQLVATPSGHTVQQEISAQRDEMLRRALSGWSPTDLQTLTMLLARFNDDLEAFRMPRDNRDRAGPVGAARSASAPTDHQEL